MEWMRIFHTLIVVLLFVPVVFMGANVFFPDLEYPQYPCLSKPYVSIPPDTLNASERLEQAECERVSQEQQRQYDLDRKRIGGLKYVFVVVLSLLSLLAALFVPLDTSIRSGLFVGATVASFFSTWIYFDSRSIPGFIVLLVIFVISILFIQKQWLQRTKMRKR